MGKGNFTRTMLTTKPRPCPRDSPEHPEKPAGPEPGWPFARGAIRSWVAEVPTPANPGIASVMNPTTVRDHERLNREWTDQFVMVKPERPELQRFKGIVGRVVTVNWNGKALIDFQDGGWYDITASDEFLTKLDPAEAKAKFNAKANSAQPYPEKQG